MSLWNKVIPDADWRVAPWSVTNCSAGPYQHGTDIYIITENNTGTALAAFKSTDSGATWALVGSGPTTADFPNDVGDGDFGTATLYCCDFNSATIYVAYWQTFFDDYPTADDSTATLGFITFDMSTDTWGSPATGSTIPVFSSIGDSIAPVFQIPLGLHYRPSTGDLVLCYERATGSGIVSSYFLVYSTAGSVTVSPTLIVTNDHHSTSFWITGGILRTCISSSGGSCWINVFHGVIKDLTHRSIDDTNALGTLQTLGTVGTSPLQINGQSWNTTGSIDAQYDAITELPYCNGSDLMFPATIIVNVGSSGTAFPGHASMLFRASPAADPTWTVETLAQFYGTDGSGGPLHSGDIPAHIIASGPCTGGFTDLSHLFFPKNLVACADGTGKSTMLFVMNTDINQSTWSSGVWSALTEVEESDPGADLLNFVGSFDLNYFSTRVALNQLDAVWGFGLDFGPGNELRTATTIHLGPTPPPPGRFGNVAGAVSSTRMAANIAI